MSKYLSVKEAIIEVIKACGRSIFWFAGATKKMFLDYAAAIQEYRSFSKRKKHKIRMKALWFLGYVMIHAVLAAVGCIVSTFAFVLLLCYDGTNILTTIQNLALVIAWLGGMGIAFLGLAGFEWETIYRAGRRRDVRVKARQLKKRALAEC